MKRTQPASRSAVPSLSLLQRVRPWLLASTTALLLVASSFWAVLWPLTWVALVPLWLALRTATARQALFLGWWTESLAYWLGFYWLVGTMVRFGFIPVPLSVLFLGIIGLGNGVRFGLLSWWLQRTTAPTHSWISRLVLPACTYVACDYLWPRVFPWYLGTLQLPALSFIQIADVTGVHGITFSIVVCSTVLAAWLRSGAMPAERGRAGMVLALAGLLLVQWGYGQWRLPQIETAMQQAQPLRVALVQPNIGMYEKRGGIDREAQLDLQLALSYATLAQQPALVIWPESMYPFGVPEQMQQLPWPQAPAGPPLHWLIGALTYAGQGTARQVYNSVLLLGPEGHILGRYAKQQLLAFGEYIPLQQYLPFLRNISPTIGNLTAGTGGIVRLPNGVGLGPLVCYEDIVPHLARQAVQQGAQVLVNLTNDIWFGDTAAPYQHRTLAAFRAIENRVYLVRVTNTGLTSIIDAVGREQSVLPLFQAEARVQTIQPLRVPTLYTRFGDWFAQLCSLIAFLVPLGRWYRQRHRHGV
ncbi:MAG: apolipoprotein N-acyltransferase [Candidatus Tectimicrobiota bacterium]